MPEMSRSGRATNRKTIESLDHAKIDPICERAVPIGRGTWENLQQQVATASHIDGELLGRIARCDRAAVQQDLAEPVEYLEPGTASRHRSVVDPERPPQRARLACQAYLSAGE